MKNKFALVVAILLGVFAMLIVYGMLQNQGKSDSQEGIPVKVALATQVVPKGTVFQREHFKWVDVPKSIYDRMSESLITQEEMEVFIGGDRKLKTDLQSKQFVLRQNFGSLEGLSTDLSDKLRPGSRALSFNVSFVEGVSGLLKPGDHVDIMCFFSLGVKGMDEYEVTTTLLQNVPILALDSFTQISGGGGGRYGTVTVMVSRKEAEILLHASNTGKLHLSLKKKNDTQGKAPTNVDNYNLIDVLNLRIKDHPLIQNWIQKSW